MPDTAMSHPSAKKAGTSPGVSRSKGGSARTAFLERAGHGSSDRFADEWEEHSQAGARGRKVAEIITKLLECYVMERLMPIHAKDVMESYRKKLYDCVSTGDYARSLDIQQQFRNIVVPEARSGSLIDVWNNWSNMAEWKDVLQEYDWDGWRLTADYVKSRINEAWDSVLELTEKDLAHTIERIEASKGR